MLSGDLANYGDTRMRLQQYLYSFILTVFANIGYMMWTVSCHGQYIPLLALCQELCSPLLLMLLPVWPIYVILYVHVLSPKQKLTDAHFVLFPKNVLGETPLHVAAARGHLEVVELLLSHGGDSQLRNKDQKTPVDLAMNSAIVNLLQMSNLANQRSSLVMYEADEYADDSDWLIHSYTIFWWI